MGNIEIKHTPHTLASAMEVIRDALEASDQVSRVTELCRGHCPPDVPFIDLHVLAQLPDHTKFTVQIRVS